MLHSKKIVRILIDLLGINTAFTIVSYLMYGSSAINKDIATLLVIVNLLWFATLSVANKLYGRFEYTTFRVEIESVLNNYVLHFFGFSLIYFLLFDIDYFYLMSFYIFLFFLLLWGRFLLNRLLPSMKQIGTLNYVIIGNSNVLSDVEATISASHLHKVNCLGAFGKSIPEKYPKLGEIKDILEFIKERKINLILYASNELTGKELRELMNISLLNFVDFKVIPLEVELLSRGVKMEIHNGFPILSVKDENIARIRNRVLKRTFDIIFSSLIIIFILSWLYPLLAFLIKRESRGPVLFNQKRIGYRNSEFVCHKFRSMVVHQDHKVVQAKKDDDRITKIGKIMRKTNLDEMPQFFNVLKGDMSVVGPRPHAVSHDIQFQNELEEYILRHYTKPGITGWAQVNGFRGPTETKEAIEGRTKHDVWYLRNWTFLLDIKIVFLTVFNVFKGEENAF